MCVSICTVLTIYHVAICFVCMNMAEKLERPSPLLVCKRRGLAQDMNYIALHYPPMFSISFRRLCPSSGLSPLRVTRSFLRLNANGILPTPVDGSLIASAGEIPLPTSTRLRW